MEARKLPYSRAPRLKTSSRAAKRRRLVRLLAAAKLKDRAATLSTGATPAARRGGVQKSVPRSRRGGALYERTGAATANSTV